MSAVNVVLGPLVGPECKRALARGWLIVVRTLASCVVLGVALVGVWWWWINRSFIDGSFQPFEVLRGFLMVCEGMLLTIALVMGPAVLAGSLAGERERGALGLLLTTRVSAREIVLGRLIGKLTQVLMVLLAGVPALILLSACAGFSLAAQAVVLVLPAAVAFGGAGLAVAASVLARRGRDALLAVYLGDVLFLLSPLGSAAGLPPEWSARIGALNPFLCLDDLIRHENLALPLATIGLWLGLGLLGTALAAWRLRPTCLGPSAGARVPRNVQRRGWVPRLDERPMLWKELFIERVGTLGRFGRWLGLLFVVVYGGGSLFFAGAEAYALYYRPDGALAQWAAAEFSLWVGQSSMFVGWLLMWAVGLRAAVTIASERERGTWDALMTSPLEGSEIVRGKLWGSLYALRWIFVATFGAWGLAYACEAMQTGPFFDRIVNTAVLCAFMAAVGVRTSLASSTATRSMALTIGIWLGAQALVFIVTCLVLGAIALMILMTTWATASLGVPTGASPFPVPAWLMRLSMPLTYHVLFGVVIVLVVADTRLRFDRIAGRMTEGRASILLDRMIHGGPAQPVLYGEGGPAPFAAQSGRPEEPVAIDTHADGPLSA